MKQIIINIRSIANQFPGQGVASMFEEHCRLASRLPAERFAVRVNSFRRADIVHCHTVEPWNLFLMKCQGKIGVVHCHFLPETLNGSLRFPKWFSRLFARYVMHFYAAADRVVAVSPQYVAKLAGLGIPQEKITYIPNYVSGDHFCPLPAEQIEEKRQELGLGPEDFAVLGVGQIMPRKGIDDFVALAELMPEVRFIWCGGFPFGAMTDDYDKWHSVVKNPPANLSFPGIIPREQMNAYYNACDLFFLPSVDEVFGMCILEAANTGTPILLRDLEVYRDIFFDQYAKGGNITEFFEQIRRVRTDPDYARLLHSGSLLLREYYSEERLLSRLAAFYEQALICKTDNSVFKKIQRKW